MNRAKAWFAFLGYTPVELHIALHRGMAWLQSPGDASGPVCVVLSEFVGPLLSLVGSSLEPAIITKNPHLAVRVETGDQ